MASIAELDRTQAIVSPGQASQGVGKGLGLYLHSEATRTIWQQADQLLGFPFTDLALYGKVNGEVLGTSAAKVELAKTENAQPAVIVTSLAAYKTLEQLGLFGDKTPYYHTGHSVGLIMALVTSGALDVEGAVKLGDARRKAFKYAIDNSPQTGFLAVQNDKWEVVQQYVTDLTQRFPLGICLINYDNQFVLGGRTEDIDEAWEYVRRENPKVANVFAKPDVEAAYHSPFMDLAVPIYGEAVDKIDIQVPTNGVLIAGSMIGEDGNPIKLETVALIKEGLVRQPNRTENWAAIIRFFGKEGVTRVTELNEGPSLVNWNRRMLGGDRSEIVLPDVKDDKGEDITIAWRWNAPAPVAQEVAPIAQEEAVEDELAEINDEVRALREVYLSLEDIVVSDTEILTAMQQFLKLDPPRTFGGMILWYSNWAALRWFKDLDSIKPDDDWIKAPHISGDSIDFEVLRADVDAVFHNPVDAEEAKDRTTSRKMAMATWEKKKALGIV